MPFINGITASIDTHDGPLPEVGHQEFSGGKSCYIPAQSGQQFWLHYIIHQPLPYRAVSVEFYVDGQRVDAQFPLSQKYSGYPSVGPVDSTIHSQYGKCTSEKGEEYAWRREIFFALLKPYKPLNPGCRPRRAPRPKLMGQYGTIDCKVFRSEVSPEWAGAVTPEDFCPPPVVARSLKSRHISHAARLGVQIKASSTKRFCVKSLDSDDAPFAWFKFYYRSRDWLEERFNLDSFPGIPPLENDQYGPLTRNSPLSFTISRLSVEERHNAEMPCDLVCRNLEANRTADSLDRTIQKLEEELITAKVEGPEQKEKLFACYEKIRKLHENSQKLRLWSAQLQMKSHPTM